MCDAAPEEAKAFEIWDRLKFGGKATTADLWFIRNELRNPSSDRALYLAIRAIGCGAASTPEHVRLVERHLHESMKDEVVAPAIDTLCFRWNLTKVYLGVLSKYADLKNWSDFSDSGREAFFCLGRYLHETQEPELYATLLRHVSADVGLLAEQERPHTLGHLRAAYRAIRIGIEGSRAIATRTEIWAGSDLDEGVLAEAQRRAIKQ